MKKTIKLLAIVMVIAMLSISLVSCGKMLNGKFTAEVDWGLYRASTTYEFNAFGGVTRTVVQKVISGDPETVVSEGKYEIMEDNENPDKLIIAFEFEGEDRVTYSYSEGTIDGAKIIIINGTTFTKAE